MPAPTHRVCPAPVVDASLFIKLPCSDVLQASHDVKKQRLGANGAPVSQVEQHDVKQTQRNKDANVTGCGSCYGAESETMKCCNTCEDVSCMFAAVTVTISSQQSVPWQL